MPKVKPLLDHADFRNNPETQLAKLCVWQRVQINYFLIFLEKAESNLIQPVAKQKSSEKHGPLFVGALFVGALLLTHTHTHSMV